MPTTNDFLEKDQIDDYLSCLTESGFAPDDFELIQQRDQPTGIIYDPQSGTITVRRKSTGIERVYKLRSGNTWPSEFREDLHRGAFTKNV